MHVYFQDGAWLSAPAWEGQDPMSMKEVKLAVELGEQR